MPRFNHFTPAAATAVVASLTVLGLMAASAVAQDKEGRFSMTPAKDGFIRLDTQNGAVSICADRDGEWSCRAMPDDQKVLQEKIARLEEENRTLKEENRRLEDVMGLNPPDPGQDGDDKDAAPPQPSGKGFNVPTEKDLDQAFDYFEGMLK
ncbi:MAG: hypothetical protein ACK5KM_08020, partial [Hyphomicrobiaceae bacterium]